MPYARRRVSINPMPSMKQATIMPAGASMSEPVFAMVLVVLAVASLLPLDEPGLAGAPSRTTEATACPG